MVLETPTLDTLLDIALALGLGLLIGLERERHRKEKIVLAGIRTYPLVSLSGLLAAEMSVLVGEAGLISVGAFVVGSFALLMYWVRQSLGNSGLTSPIALFATYFVGVFIGVGQGGLAVIVGIVIVFLLFTKERLHRVAEVLTPQEMEGALYFLVLAFILYPVLPVEYVTEWGTFRFRDYLLIVLLVSLISFLSFLAIRRWGGEFGVPFSGFLGGLVNSEATTASLAGIQKKRASFLDAATVGVLLATGTMFVRNLVIAGIADPGLDMVERMLVPMLLPSLVLALWALYIGRRNPQGKTEPIELKSPFAFRPAFVFAFWFTLVSVFTVQLQRIPDLGERAIYIASLGGIVSAGAVVASMGHLVATDQAPVATAAAAAVLASLFSALNKSPIAWLGTNELARRLLLPTIAAASAGGALLLAFL